MYDNIIVYESCRNLRALGRSALARKWQLAVLGTLLYGLLVMVPVFILDMIFGGGKPSGVSGVYNLLVTGPMTLGFAMFSISIFRNRETSPAEVFYGFERFGKAFGLYIVMTIFIILWTFLLVVPGIIAAFRYSMSFYILADNPDIGIMEAINESKRMMRGNKWKFFCLNLSFIGWGLLCLLTMGIGFLWLAPYLSVTMVAFYDIANGSLRRADRGPGLEEGYRGDAYRGDNGASGDPWAGYQEESKDPASEIKSIETKAPDAEASGKPGTDEDKD
jgi:uncharacterized membrane protein